MAHHQAASAIGGAWGNFRIDLSGPFLLGVVSYMSVGAALLTLACRRFDQLTGRSPIGPAAPGRQREIDSTSSEVVKVVVGSQR